MSKLRLPSPALVVACVALAVALGGTALAATPVVKRALFADNAGKLQGKTLAQISAQVSAQLSKTATAAATQPGPASTAASLVSTTSAAFNLNPDEGRYVTTQCPSGLKAISGGYLTQSPVHPWDNGPTADGAGWTMFLSNGGNTAAAAGTSYVVCIR